MRVWAHLRVQKIACGCVQYLAHMYYHGSIRQKSLTVHETQTSSNAVVVSAWDGVV